MQGGRSLPLRLPPLFSLSSLLALLALAGSHSPKARLGIDKESAKTQDKPAKD